MKKLLMRADDLGFSEAVNYGIAKMVREGLIRNCGVMVNMDATEHGGRLLEGASCCLGLHCNVSVGRPLCPPEEVPSLVDSRGIFHSSRRYREAAREFATVEDFHRELTAQYRRFLELFGRKPAYFEAHTVRSENLRRALEQVAEENGLFYQPSFCDFTLGGYLCDQHAHAQHGAGVRRLGRPEAGAVKGPGGQLPPVRLPPRLSGPIFTEKHIPDPAPGGGGRHAVRPGNPLLAGRGGFPACDI